MRLKRVNLSRAFNLLAERNDNEGIESNRGLNKEVFEELIHLVITYISKGSKHDSTLVSIYWSLLESNQILTEENFYQLLDLFNYKIQIIDKSEETALFERQLRSLYETKWSKVFTRAVKSQYFRNVFDTLILLNTVLIGLGYDHKYIEWSLLWLFTFEILSKLYTFGLISFLQKFWNIFDIIVIGTALVLCLVIAFKQNLAQEFGEYLDLLLILRVLRLCKVIVTIKRFKVVAKTILALIPSISTYAGLLFVIYYIYALIGLRLFKDNDRTTTTTISCDSNDIRCCLKNQTLNANYCGINFNTFPNAMLLLFDLMLVNQWHVFARTQELISQTKLTRIFFVSFNLVCVILVLNIFTAFILEAFILEYIDLTERKSKTSLQLRLEAMGVECTDKRASTTQTQTKTIDNEYSQLDDWTDADHDLHTNQLDDYLSLNLSGLKIILREKKSVELLLMKMFANEISVHSI